jgi:hypothetical protein
VTVVVAAALVRRRWVIGVVTAMTIAGALPVLVLFLVVVGPPPAETAPGGGSAQPHATGTRAAVGGFVVDASIAGPLRALLASAESDGLTFGGSGLRSSEEQVALRRAHCGTSEYAVYRMPAADCSPPTARPGSSMHERGLAIDFTCGGRLVSRGDWCFSWLAANGPAQGFFNLPSEPWHWSVNGR